MQKTSQRYQSMCFEAKELQDSWIPREGDAFLLHASRCKSRSCNRFSLCETCLEMCHHFTLAGHHDEEVFFFDPKLCNRDGGRALNDTRASLFVPTGGELSKLSLNFRHHLPTYQNETTWVPSQSRLQELVVQKKGGKQNELHHLMNGFATYYNSLSMKEVTSLEEVWMGYTMKEVYDKTWNGESWEKIS